jgi:hypothetical protein
MTRSIVKGDDNVRRRVLLASLLGLAACAGAPVAAGSSAVSAQDPTVSCASDPDPPACASVCLCNPGYSPSSDGTICVPDECLPKSCSDPDNCLQVCPNEPCYYDCVRVGARINPSTPTGPQSIDDVDCSVGRPLDYSLHYEDFEVSAAKFPGETADDAQTGSTPIISLGCETDADRANLESEIEGLADAYWQFGRPILVRYCWEMNIPKDGGSAPRGGDSRTFVPEWQHLHDRLTHLQKVKYGSSNVLWFFCPSSSGGADYFPGDQYIDYAGWDDYDNYGVGFYLTMNPDYNTYASITSKPFIIGETGTSPSGQPGYFDDAEYALGRSFQRIVGMNYFDAGNDKGGDWEFSDAGAAAFVSFARFEK